MSLEDFVKSMPNNVVLRSANENKPSIFVRHPLQNSIEFDPILPDHPHPAFMHGDSADPAVLIGKYKNHLDSITDVPCSIPNATDSGIGLSYNNVISRTHAFGGNVQPITIADHGLVVLIAHKNKLCPHGNTGAGHADKRAGTAWSSSAGSYTAGTVRIYQGWAYECVKNHTASSALSPIKAPGYWKRLNKVGGTPGSPGSHTLTGSGPLNWYLLDDINMEADLNGSGAEIMYGVRLVDGEIQIIDPAYMSDPETNITESSTLWKAILPHANDNGHDLVAPGTAGTLHYTRTSGTITIVARELDASEKSNTTYTATQFKNILTDSLTITTMPAIMYELGLAPIPGTEVEGYFEISTLSGTHYALRTGAADNSYTGIGAIKFNYITGTSEERIFISSRSRARVDT